MSIRYGASASLALILVTLGLLPGCTMPTHIFESKKVDYKTQPETGQPLDVPPDLTPITPDDRYAIPDRDKGKGTTYSQYSKDQGQGQGQGQGTAKPAAEENKPAAVVAVLPQLANGVRMERDGALRWLVVKATPEQVWPVLKAFWISNGFTLKLDDPKIGVMETDWAQSREAAPQDFFKRMLNTVVDNLFSSPLRDKYRTRIERGAEPGTTEIYVTHKGMEEVLAKDYTGTSWQTRPEDVELENEYLKKLALRLGTSQSEADALMADNGAKKDGKDFKDAKDAKDAKDVKDGNKGTQDEATKGSAEKSFAKIVKQPDGDLIIAINEPFDRAWRRVGLALDRSGFTVEDRDRAAGVYYVRFTDSDVPKQYRQKEGFWSGLMFWKSEDKSKETQTYRITITTISGRGTHLDVRDKAENRVNPETTQRMINLIYEKL